MELEQFGDGAGVADTPVITRCILSEDDSGKVLLSPTPGNADPQVVALSAQYVARSETEVLKFMGLDDTRNVVRETWSGKIDKTKLIPPPYDPSIATYFLGVDETIHRCVHVKAHDVVYRGYRLTPKHTQALTPQADDEESIKVDVKALTRQQTLIEDFMESCAPEGFLATVHRAVLDCETFGWAALEVVRSADLAIRELKHIPAARLRVVPGQGFIENTADGAEVYYQTFGDKVRSATRTDIYTKSSKPYDPKLDGPLTTKSAIPRYVSWKTGQATTSFAESASEVLWVVKKHPSTMYYGVSDSIPVAGQILSNVHMREYLRQFFEHNAVPRYAVIIKGASLDPTVEQAIVSYFSSHVKGRHHKTIVIPLPTARGTNVEVKFEKLELSNNEQWFTEPSIQASHSTRMAHGVSAAIAGFNESASLGSGKGMAQAEIYKERTVAPLQVLWGDAITRLFRYGLGVTDLRFEFIPLDVRDRETESRIHQAALDRGAMTLNEYRAAMGIGGAYVKGGDRAFIKLSGTIVFVDELTELRSGQMSNNTPQPGDKQPSGNSLANVASGRASGTGTQKNGNSPQ